MVVILPRGGFLGEKPATLLPHAGLAQVTGELGGKRRRAEEGGGRRAEEVFAAVLVTSVQVKVRPS